MPPDNDLNDAVSLYVYLGPGAGPNADAGPAAEGSLQDQPNVASDGQPNLWHVGAANTAIFPVYRDVNFSWAFILQDHGAHTRLIMRARVSCAPVVPAPIIRLLIAAGFGVGDVVQAGAMLAGIKARAESRPVDC